MTRILYWNIDQFDFNKIADPSEEPSDIQTMTKAQKAAGRLAYIKMHLKVKDENDAEVKPDIIVIVEVPVQDTYTGRGRLTTGGGPDGVRQLLGEIRTATTNDQWMLVPPLQTGEKEVVAVYYDSTNYVFTGPWQWRGGDTGPSFNPTAPEPPANGDYDDLYKNTLRDRTIPEGALYNKDVSEQRVAASTDFTYAVGHAQAGTPVDFGTDRAPYWVSFAQLKNAAVSRNISLFAIHGPKSDTEAETYLRTLAKIAEIVDGVKDKEARIVLGDFNLNLFESTATLPIKPAYDDIKAKYAFGITRPGDPPNLLKGYKGFFATFLKRTQNASYWVVGPTGDFYPCFGYFGSFNKSNFYCSDNIFSLYGTNSEGPMTNVTVLNGVVGANYGLHPLAPAPSGYYKFPIVEGEKYPIALADDAAFAPPPEKAPALNDGRRTAFREWRNYLRIYDTSDHMAIVADV